MHFTGAAAEAAFSDILFWYHRISRCSARDGTVQIGPGPGSPLFLIAHGTVWHKHVFREIIFEICRTLEKREIHAKFAAGEKVTQKLPPS